jgi:hypothetical protein
VDVAQVSDGLIALVIWVVVSILAAPLVGHFLAGALHERIPDEPRRTSTRRIKPEHHQSPASGPVAASSSGP